MLRPAWLIAMSLALAPALSHSATVDVFSPQGEVKGVRQVAARFSEAMVAFGDPRLAEPFDIDCPEKGSARWADQKNWVFDFERDLPAGVRCSFKVKAGSEDQSTAQPVEPRRFPFTHRRTRRHRVPALPLRPGGRGADLHPRAGCAGQARHGGPARLLRRQGRHREDPGQAGHRRRAAAGARQRARISSTAICARCSRTAGSRAIAERDLLRGTRAEQLKSADETKFPVVTAALCAAPAQRCRAAAGVGAGHRVAAAACRPARTRCWSSRCARRSRRSSPASA